MNNLSETDVPACVYCFITEGGKVTAVTRDKNEANAWLEYRRSGDSVCAYKLVKAETK